MTGAFRLPVHELRLKPNLPCGMNYMLVGAIAHTLRTTHTPVEPILVAWRAEFQGWLLIDGRHRWVAHLVAGRSEVWCVEDGAEGG